VILMAGDGFHCMLQNLLYILARAS
jgi:hypothetical protein